MYEKPYNMYNMIYAVTYKQEYRRIRMKARHMHVNIQSRQVE